MPLYITLTEAREQSYQNLGRVEDVCDCLFCFLVHSHFENDLHICILSDFAVEHGRDINCLNYTLEQSCLFPVHITEMRPTYFIKQINMEKRYICVFSVD